MIKINRIGIKIFKLDLLTFFHGNKKVKHINQGILVLKFCQTIDKFKDDVDFE